MHTLRDGGQLTIRNGVLATRPWSEQGVLPSEGICQQLVNRVCGSDGRCSGSTACQLARQMDTMQRQTVQHRNSPAQPSPAQPSPAITMPERLA